jgi:hypothetical protein
MAAQPRITAIVTEFDRRSLASLPLAPEHLDSLARFLALTRAEVDEEARLSRHTVRIASVWSGLSALMRRRSFQAVRELGVPAAASWAAHLGLIPRIQSRPTADH